MRNRSSLTYSAFGRLYICTITCYIYACFEVLIRFYEACGFTIFEEEVVAFNFGRKLYFAVVNRIKLNGCVFFMFVFERTLACLLSRYHRAERMAQLRKIQKPFVHKIRDVQLRFVQVDSMLWNGVTRYYILSFTRVWKILYVPA